MTAEHPDVAAELEATQTASAIREREIADGWARVAAQDRAEQQRVNRELARQAGQRPADHRNGGTP